MLIWGSCKNASLFQVEMTARSIVNNPKKRSGCSGEHQNLSVSSSSAKKCKIFDGDRSLLH